MYLQNALYVMVRDEWSNISFGRSFLENLRDGYVEDFEFIPEE